MALKLHRHIVFLSGICMLAISCNRESFLNDSSVRLNFSTDTVTFDTVFSTLGSATRQLKVYNPYGQSLRISSVTLAGGQASMFRLNIDGTKGTSLRNIDLLPHDSLYIFVAVTVDPSGANNPVVVNDSIEFRVNGNLQRVNLVAWGQDIHFFKNETIGSQTWTADKPYLVYGYLDVDSGQVLTIGEGVKIYFHRNSFLFVRGSLVVQGSLQNPVIFRGDRLEHDYDEIPGQWGAIILMEGSTGNSIDYAEILNPTVGIQIGTDTLYQAQDLQLSNTKIFNASYYGLWAIGSRIKAWNTIVANCGQWAIALLRGGEYGFYHCTVSNRGVIFSNRLYPSVVLANYIGHYDPVTGQTINYPGDLVKAEFKNSILYGNMENEVGIANGASGGTMDYLFDHCLIRMNPSVFSDEEISHFSNIISDKEPGFINSENYNFELDTLSACKDVGDKATGILYPVDFKGNSRTSDNGPDLGAFERIEIAPHK